MIIQHGIVSVEPDGSVQVVGFAFESQDRVNSFPWPDFRSMFLAEALQWARSRIDAELQELGQGATKTLREVFERVVAEREKRERFPQIFDLSTATTWLHLSDGTSLALPVTRESASGSGA